MAYPKDRPIDAQAIEVMTRRQKLKAKEIAYRLTGEASSARVSSNLRYLIEQGIVVRDAQGYYSSLRK